MGQAEHQLDEDERALLELLPADGSRAASEGILDRLGWDAERYVSVPVPGWKGEDMCRPGRAALRPFTGI